MSEDEILGKIQGAKSLRELFGYWPNFHDSEVVSITLDRKKTSSLTVHAFVTTSDLTDTGHYLTKNHTLVTFEMSQITDSEILGFNQQNVLSGLDIEKEGQDYKVLLGGCYGAEGWIKAKTLAISLTPGMPPGSVYRDQRGGAP